MTKQNNNSSSTPQKINNNLNELKQMLSNMERKVTSLEQKNVGLEKRIEQLETDVAISVNVTSQLAM